MDLINDNPFKKALACTECRVSPVTIHECGTGPVPEATTSEKVN